MKVLEGELTLKGMHDWLENAKKLNVSHVALANHLNCNGFEEVRKRYPHHSTLEQISAFQLAFKNIVSVALYSQPCSELCICG